MRRVFFSLNQRGQGTVENLMNIDPDILKKSFVSILVDDIEKDQIENKIKILEQKGVLQMIVGKLIERLEIYQYSYDKKVKLFN